MNPTAAWLSVTGSVFGIAQIAVNPPAAAARAPLATVSSSSLPGSRRCTCRSTRPGVTTLPFTLRTTAPSGAFKPRPTLAIFPSSINTSAAPSRSRLGSMTCPPCSRIAEGGGGLTLTSFCGVGELGAAAGQQIEHRHANRHAVRHLIEDDAVRPIGDPRIDLDAAVHGAGMHDGDRFRRALEALGRHAEDAVVLAHARDEALLHPLELQPQHVEHVGPLDRLFDPSEDLHTQLLDPARQQRPRPAHRDLERNAGAGGGLKEQMDDRLAAQCWYLLDGPLRHFLERLGGVEDQPDLLGRHVLEPGEVFAEGRGGVHRITST